MNPSITPIRLAPAIFSLLIVVLPVYGDPAPMIVVAPSTVKPMPPQVESNNGLAATVGSMKFDRTPESLLQAVQTQQSGKPLSEAERFRISVILGDWDAVGKSLASLPIADARAAYARMLASLVASSQSAAQFYQQAQRNAKQRPQENEDQRKSLLLSDDFYAVLAASPADLDESNINVVAELVKIAIGDAGKIEFMSRLAAGLRGIGGEKPDGRRLAARLLSSVGWITDAANYLPLKREQWEQADTLSLVLAMEYYTQAGIKDRDERLLKRSAEVCAFMMQTSRFGQNEQGLFRQATDRFVKLLPAMEAGEAEQLIRENFLTQPAILQDLILVLGESGQQAIKSTDLNLRAQSLATQNALLRVLASRKGAPPEAVNLLIANWLSEAEATYRSAIAPSLDPDGSGDLNVMLNNYYSRRNQEEVKVVKPELIIPNAPPQLLVKRLSKGLAQRVNLTLLKVNLMNPKEPVTIDLLGSYLKANPGQEKSLCQDYLVAWVRKRSVPAEDPNIVRMRNLGYNISGRQANEPGGIPLTRLRQNNNVGEFKKLLEKLRSMTPDPLDPTVIVQGFMAIHSGAEVYRINDIEAIFGPAEKMEVNELMQLVSGMRGKLKEQWQDPKTQQGAGTNRTEKEIKDEVSRGYQTALDLLKRGLSPEKADWKQYIIRGQLFFDASEFEFARQIKLSDYVNLRDDAFASYRKAAELYARTVPELAHGQWVVDPYQMWFFAMLGASDLSQLTRTAARADPGLKQIGDAMRALPGEAAEGHLLKFGQMLSSTLSQVPGNLRQHFLGAGLQVIGKDHPAAKTAAESLANYEELLDEVRLNLALDGPAAVGHGQPFGVFVSIEHTRQLARESGGFSKYLQNANNKGMGMGMGMPQSTPEVNYRDNFTKNIHAALDETFEVVSITFHDAAVKAIDLPREGWQQTPVAYVLLRAKEAAVDRIPSLQMDMDFSDTAGRVVLPVRSQVLQLDAKPDVPVARPCPELGLAFTMDEREWQRDGRVVVEIAAKGRGVIASHDQLFDYNQPGFDVEVSDGGLSITEFVSDNGGRAVNADRSWQLTYKRNKNLTGNGVLKFPTLKPGIQVAHVEYQHYQDADLLPIDASKAELGVALQGGGASWTGRVLVAVVGLLVGVVLIVVLRRKKHAVVVEHQLDLPAVFTPFTVVAFLRRVQHQGGSRIDDAARATIQQEIDAIEAANYRNPPSPTDAKSLETTARKWLDVSH